MTTARGRADHRRWPRILFVAIVSMVMVLLTLPNHHRAGLLPALPFVVLVAGGWSHAHVLHRLRVLARANRPQGSALPSTFLLPAQSMYQKFYAARSPKEARRAVAIWIVGTIVVETVVIAIAVYASVYNAEHQTIWDPRSLVLNAARHMVPAPVGILLLAAACAVVLSTGMNYLLSSSSNVIRDIYQRMIRPDADPTKMVALQKVFVVALGVCAFLMIFIPTALKLQISVLQYAYFAYTMYGVAVTPALFAALTWKRATRQGGLASIVSGAIATVFFEIVLPRIAPSVMQAAQGKTGAQVFGGDAWGIPSIYPAALISIGALVIVSLLTKAPDAEQLRPLFGERQAGG
jgi:Na+/proline symporter